MVKVTKDGIVLAESNDTIVVENNHYFPPSSLNQDVFSPSSTSSKCPWKGTAAYYDATINDNIVKDIAWYYPEPKEKASAIKGYVAFYKNKVDTEA